MLKLYRERQRGATLLEVLITMVVLAIGLLGLAGLQMTSIQSNHGSYYRSQATVLAYDLSDRMRANRSAVLGGAYEADFPNSSDANNVGGSRAQRDVAEWLNSLAAALPGGTGKIDLDGNLITIQIRWNDTRAEIKDVNDLAPHTETFIYRTEI